MPFGLWADAAAQGKPALSVQQSDCISFYNLPVPCVYTVHFVFTDLLMLCSLISITSIRGSRWDKLILFYWSLVAYSDI